MTSPKATASRRPQHPTKRKPARATKPVRASNACRKQEHASRNVPLASAQTETETVPGGFQNLSNVSSSVDSLSLPHSVDLRKENTITVKEAAFRLKKSEDTVYSWLRAGRLRGRQPGGKCCGVLVEVASVEEALLCEIGSDSKARTS